MYADDQGLDRLARLPIVLADSQRLAQCIRNYLANAIRFSSEGGTVEMQVLALPRDEAVAIAQSSGSTRSYENKSLSLLGGST